MTDARTKTGLEGRWCASRRRQASASLTHPPLTFALGSDGSYARTMITCVVHYTINPEQLEAFEQFAREWIRLVNKHGGTHHGYFLPAEGASDKAEALFSFNSLADYEQYRQLFGIDPESHRSR